MLDSDFNLLPALTQTEQTDTFWGFDQYQVEAKKTAIYHDRGGPLYPFLGLAGETGEVLEKMKKFIRDGSEGDEDKLKEDLAKELGDVLWYLANIASDRGLSLREIARINLQKLADRQERGVLRGSGDSR